MFLDVSQLPVSYEILVVNCGSEILISAEIKTLYFSTKRIVHVIFIYCTKFEIF